MLLVEKKFNASKKLKCEYLACCNTDRVGCFDEWKPFYTPHYNNHTASYKYFYRKPLDLVDAFVEWCDDLYCFANGTPFTFQYFLDHYDTIAQYGIHCFTCLHFGVDCAGDASCS